ncbi:MAG TPA: DUF6152 family protein [Terriglobia bacterium]|nr:DUF6152 family protein [Terriglobia bacterium]
MKARVFVLLFAFVMLSAFGTAPIRAHHAATMFDTTKVIEIKGTVKELQWTNPHIWIQIYVEKSDGSREEWSIEGGGPNSLSRQGWRPTTFKPGDLVTLRINPMRDGSSAGLFVGAKFSNATTLGRWDPQP